MIAKCAIKLRKHDIEFKGRNSTKGQIMADFLAETPFGEDNDTKTEKSEIMNKASTSENMWKFYMDGASSSDGFSAGVMLVSLKGKEFTYGLRFEFKTTNNEAEYEALLADIRIAVDMEIKDLAIFIDSQLVANQVQVLFKARKPVIKQYLEKLKEVLRSFDNYSIKHIHRNQNKKADTLSKLASMTFEHLTKEVLVEVLEEETRVLLKMGMESLAEAEPRSLMELRKKWPTRKELKSLKE
ncbi:reverse transcriptase domain-containing protein [Tanacetum coccineum]